MNNEKIWASVAFIIVLAIMGLAVYKSQSTSMHAPGDYYQPISNPEPNPMPNPNPTPLPSPSPTPVVKGSCYVGGCSGEVCSDQKDIASACLYRPEYACYKKAKCERQTDGQCGWTRTSAVSACLENNNNSATAQ